MPAHRTTARTAAVVVLSAAVTAAGVLAVAAPALAGAQVARSAAPLVRYAAPGGDEVPAGATGRVQAVATPRGTTTVTLTVTGLLPHETYGAHAHVKACDDGFGGGHLQLVRAPSPEQNTGAYANPVNEVWLDLTTDATGTGHAKAQVPWQIAPGQGMRSVIIHRNHTSSAFAAGVAGTAGPKLACLDAVL